MKLKYLFLFLCLSFLVCTSSVHADSTERTYRAAARNFHKLYKDSPFRKYQSNWIKTIEKFQSIYRNHPRHKRADDSLYNIGRLYRSLYKWNHKQIFLDRSNIAFRRLVRDYQSSSLADDGQFLLAENYEVYLKDRNLAYLEYKKLVDLYPERAKSRKAREKLKSLNPPHKDMQMEPAVETAASISDLTVAKFGGLSEAENTQQRPKVLVSKVDYWSTADWSRMVINVKNDVRYKYQVLGANPKFGKGRRMYLDIKHSFLPKKFKKRIAANDGLIKQARLGQFDKDTVRIVLDLASLNRIKVFHFKLPNQYKIVIDILGNSAIAGVKKKVSPPKDLKTYLEPKVPVDTPQVQALDGKDISLTKAFGLKVKRIVIDPGHGGKDPGAIGFGLMEKDITLKLAFAVKKLINKKHPEIEVLMTRTKDVFISLEARTAFANKHHADLFLSVHINASRSQKANGMETYVLNLTTDSEALALAAKENQTSLKSISELQNILNDLMTNTKIHESTQLAEFIQNDAVKKIRNQYRIGLRNLGVKKAPFIVLLGAKMPCVLIEAGFITNKRENRLLKSKNYHKALAAGIYAGVSNYINI